MKHSRKRVIGLAALGTTAMSLAGIAGASAPANATTTVPATTTNITTVKSVPAIASIPSFHSIGVFEAKSQGQAALDTAVKNIRSKSGYSISQTPVLHLVYGGWTASISYNGPKTLPGDSTSQVAPSEVIGTHRVENMGTYSNAVSHMNWTIAQVKNNPDSKNLIAGAPYTEVFKNSNGTYGYQVTYNTSSKALFAEDSLNFI